ncbi:MAG: HAMP domain-containing histidine kinase [Spirulina sp. SIO3F2]|nr:HAMP domain-containing histidine kinase [Spirulina sp. SIO3F2]
MRLPRFFAPQRSKSPQHFTLLRNFSLVSLSAFVVATGLLAIFYRQQSVQRLVTLTEENNVALTQTFSNTLWQEQGEFLSSTQDLNNEALRIHPRIMQLQQDVLAQFEGLSVVKIKVYDLQGRTVFSSESSQIGLDKGGTSGFIAAKSGQVVSQLGHRDTFKALQTTIKDRDLLSSYIPIYAEGQNSEVVGVFELYTDVTPLLQNIDQTQQNVVLGSLLILTILYGVLYLFVQRADHLIKQQYAQLQASESHSREQAKDLAQAMQDLQQTQAQVLQNEKMSSLGQLVAGVAHEINNPVSFIHGNLSHLQTYAQGLLSVVGQYQQAYPQPNAAIQAEIEELDLEFIQADLPKLLDSMHMGSDRIREIVLSLRNFSRLDEAGIKCVNLHEGIDNTLVILSHRLKIQSDRAEICIIKDYAVLPPIDCYAGSLNQVFMNILVNAIDAIETKIKNMNAADVVTYVPTITLRTWCLDGQVTVAIADNGSGMTSQVLKRMFEPFFTTKDIGKGTGMGMSISYQVVTEKHGGTLNCSSQPGQGTQFIIQLPMRQATQLPKPNLMAA